MTERTRAGLNTADDLLEARWRAGAERTSRDEAAALATAGRGHLGRLEELLGAVEQRSSLARPSAEVYRAELEVLETRRRSLLEDLRRLTVVAETAGRVVTVLAEGSSVARGGSVATVMPERATEIVAYLPPESSPDEVSPGARVTVRGGEGVACAEPGVVLRRGAQVEQAPGQLATLWGSPVYGTPCYISMPEACAYGVGQVVTVHLDGRGSR
jgi:multidrug resistance efflux pump